MGFPEASICSLRRSAALMHGTLNFIAPSVFGRGPPFRGVRFYSSRSMVLSQFSIQSGRLLASPTTSTLSTATSVLGVHLDVSHWMRNLSRPIRVASLKCPKSRARAKYTRFWEVVDLGTPLEAAPGIMTSNFRKLSVAESISVRVFTNLPYGSLWQNAINLGAWIAVETSVVLRCTFGFTSFFLSFSGLGTLADLS